LAFYQPHIQKSAALANLPLDPTPAFSKGTIQWWYHIEYTE